MVPWYQKNNELLRLGRGFVRIPKAGAHPSTTNMLEYVPASVVSPFFVAVAKPERSPIITLEFSTLATIKTTRILVARWKSNDIMSWYLAPRRNALHIFDRACTRQSSIPQSHMSHDSTVDIVTVTDFWSRDKGGRLWRPFQVPRAKRIDIDHQHFPVCLAWEVHRTTTHIAIQNSQKPNGLRKLHETLGFCDCVIFFTHVGLCIPSSSCNHPMHPSCILQPLPEGSWPSSIRQTAPKTRHRTMVPTWCQGKYQPPDFQSQNSKTLGQPLSVHQPNQSWIAKLCPFPFLEKLCNQAPNTSKGSSSPGAE